MSRGHEESQTKSERISAANRRKRENAREGKGQITGLAPAWIDARRIDNVPDGEPIANYFPAAIDKELFLRVQAQRSNPGKPGRKGDTFANLFTGLCHCAHCGGPMTMKMSRVKGNENGRYLVCANYVRGHRCAGGNRHFRYEPLEAAILDHVKELNLAETLHALRLDDAHRELDETIAGLTLELEELRRRERRLAQAIEDDSEPPDAILNLLKTRQTERQAIEAELRHQQAERQRRSIRQDSPTETCDRIGKLRGAWEQADDITRYDLRSEAHAAIREIIAEISFDSGDCSTMLIVENGIVVHRFTDGRASRRHQMWRAMPVTMRSAV
ncbi:zinc ribbon domain-containing protein [Rhizobium mulingense]|uniref:zinc ribbon domain-containing protein n=1 Tax=Rhizobium mulingense TaxID=3031128 RepID=UPI002B49E660|nr:zinc ribbon domain-containing protein [Rhizobium sp. MJ21]MEB3047674.1 zinc ribbon domain-containing protein [Rhizobium sp. MJ21]